MMTVCIVATAVMWQIPYLIFISALKNASIHITRHSASLVTIIQNRSANHAMTLEKAKQKNMAITLINFL
jgi:ribosomal protein L20